MFEKWGGARGRLVLRVAIVLLRLQWLSVKERHGFIENRDIARRSDVLGRHVGEPGQVIRAACSHPTTRGRVPPVQNVSLLELMLGRLQNVRPRDRRGGMEHRKDVLKLVAISERSARLIEPGATKDPRRERLVQEPTIEHEVHGGLGGLHADAFEKSVPIALEVVPRALNDGPVAKARHERKRVGAAGRLA